jgi:UDP-glucose 4-epimerase
MALALAHDCGEGMKKLLITGISGGTAKVLTRALHKQNDICGVDPIPWTGVPRGVRIYPVDLRKRPFEDVVSAERPDAIVHLGFVRHFEMTPRRRRENSIQGTERLLQHCIRYGVSRLVVVSSGYVYGARPENPFHLDEIAPLSADRRHTELRDLVELDTIATSFLWRAPELATCVLRPVNVIGPTVRSMAARYLRLRRVPTVMGFDPMMQFVHEEDVAGAIQLALEHELRGVYNLVGPGEVPIRTAIEACGSTAWPVPEPLLRPVLGGWLGPLGRLGWGGDRGFPLGIVDYLKYPVTLSGARFVEQTGFEPRYGLADCFDSMRSR